MSGCWPPRLRPSRAALPGRCESVGRSRQPLTSFSHGAAGIVLALSRLWAETGDRRFRAGALKGLAFERAVFDETEGNWPDLRQADVGFGVGWCHGAPGIGLARLAGRGILDDPTIDEEIEAALRWTEVHAVEPPVNLCCGEPGRIDLLLTAGLDLDRPVLVEIARARAAEMLDAARKRRFQFPLGDHRRNPSLFQGLAGVGYQLLRLEAPARLPSLLAW